MLESILSVVGGAFSGLWGYLVAAGAALVSVLAVYLKGRSDRAKDERIKAQADKITRLEKEREVDQIHSDDLPARLSRWLRDGD